MESKLRSGGILNLDIDKDVRSVVFDKLLLDNGFKYCWTTDSSSGGKRKYSHESGIIVVFFRGTIDLNWYIDRSSDNKQLDHGSGFISMTTKIKKYIR